ncbi:hypothetical protein AMTR_s00049p00044160 [Amborella trichopoda]|uniref:Fungal lipase-type domain-containing protein n=2 Tax=Amborella trichopoda TaxID=13333 RepID=W1PZS1_AMBTC|nr:hypothetical protein AMTR_s00049p00044160 [Amborella trichopoda]
MTHGSDNWDNLLDPLDPSLRSELIRYGEFVDACYKAFDLDPNSKRHCNCKYGRTQLLDKVGLQNSGYEITKYIYASADINFPIGVSPACMGRWVGYIAVSTDSSVRKLGRRDVIVAFRGTVTRSEWLANFMSSLTPARLDPHNPRPDVKVESGFLNLYTSTDESCKFGLGSCREQLLSEISRLISKYGSEEEMSITLAGHSMGSSLAMLLAYDIGELELNKPINGGVEIPITVFSYGGPRVGNHGFRERCEELGVKVLRVVNVSDPITKLPGMFFNENFTVLGGDNCYTHVGVELPLESLNGKSFSCVHDLDTYLGLLRCPTKKVKKGELMERACGFFKRQKLESWSWQHMATLLQYPRF